MKDTKAPKKQLTKIQLKLRAKLWTAIASLIIFGSWFSQNYFQSNWHAEVVKLERDKLAISQNEINKNLYQILLNTEETKGESDTLYNPNLRFLLRGYCIYANILHKIGKNSGTDDEIEKDKNQFLYELNSTNIQNCYDTNNVLELRKIAVGFSEWEAKKGSTTINNYQIRLSDLRKQEDRWNQIYFYLYIIGGFLFIVVFIYDYRALKLEKV